MRRYCKYGLLFCFSIFLQQFGFAQSEKNFPNPIIHADYSDPDAIRVGNDYYMIASSFNSVPGLPILHSTDLVHWNLIGHALPKLFPVEHYNKVQHGGGVWAPAIRYHKGEFYIYYPDPDFGIYLIKSKTITGPWSTPILIEEGKGLIDPCPFWDEDNRCYLVHAFAGSRAGIKSILVIKEMNKEGDKIIGNPVLIYDGHNGDPTLEGPKIYKRNGYYYVFAPSGGVKTGWQIALRSKNIFGPYERKIVMHQGKSPVNGPHQGAWINTPFGKDWFVHFQDKDAYGRIVHLQPMQWKNDWPIIGEDKDGDGIGEPVKEVMVVPATSVKNETSKFDILKFQWQANKQNNWGFKTADGAFKLFSVFQKDSTSNLWNCPNLLTEKFFEKEFIKIYKLKFDARLMNEKAGFVVFGLDYANLSFTTQENNIKVIKYSVCKDADKNKPEILLNTDTIQANEVYVKLQVTDGAVCTFSYSINGKDFTFLPQNFIAKPGKWVGSKIGFYFNRFIAANDAGSAEIEEIK